MNMMCKELQRIRSSYSIAFNVDRVVFRKKKVLYCTLCSTSIAGFVLLMFGMISNHFSYISSELCQLLTVIGLFIFCLSICYYSNYLVSYMGKHLDALTGKNEEG